MKIVEVTKSSRDSIDLLKYEKLITQMVDGLESDIAENLSSIDELCDQYNSISTYLLNFSTNGDELLKNKLSTIRLDLISMGGASYLSENI